MVQGGFASVHFKVNCFGSRILWFGSRLLLRFKVMSAVGSVPSVLFGSRLLHFEHSCRCGSRQTTTSLSVGSFTLVQA